ncbi:MAG: hypothetical protein PHS14_17395 [Elusimicrobia bacterium]|nr:hypothetical protein [Elusimicrobiota bacterium]
MTYIDDHVRDPSILKWNLIEIQFTPTLRLATSDFDVVALSNIFLGRSSGDGRPCSVPSISAQGGVLNSAVIEITDADNLVFGKLRATGGGQGIGVNVWEAWFDPTNKSAIPDGTRIRAAGKIDSSKKDSSSGTDLVTINLVGAGKGSNVYVPPRLASALSK